MTPRPAVAVAALLLVAAGCGDDGGGGGGDPEAFCDQLEQLDEEGLDLNDEQAFERLDDLVELAPDDVGRDLRRLIKAGQDLEDLPEDDPDSFEAAFEIILDPAVLSALNGFGEYARDECDIEVPGTDIDPDNPFGDLSDLSDVSGDFSTELSTDFSTDFSTDASDDEPSNTDLLEAYFDENYGDTDWVDLISSRGIGTVGDTQASVTLGLDEAVDGDTAVEVCDAALAWSEQAGFASTDVEIQGPGQETLASGDEENGCDPA